MMTEDTWRRPNQATLHIDAVCRYIKLPSGWVPQGGGGGGITLAVKQALCGWQLLAGGPLASPLGRQLHMRLQEQAG